MSEELKPDECIEKLKQYEFKDDIGHPLEMCVEYIQLCAYTKKGMEHHVPPALVDGKYDDEEEQKSTAAHIAANSPDVVMADIDEILRLREKVERLEREADWLALVLANAGCGVPLTVHIDEDVNGMSPPEPEHWREAARKAVETSHEN